MKKIVSLSASIVPCLAFVLAAAPNAHATPYTGVAYCGIQSNSGGNGSGYATSGVNINTLSNAESTSEGVCANFTGTNSISYATGSDSTAAASPGVTGGTSLNNFLNYSAGLTSSSYTAEGSANGAPAATATGSQDDGGTLLVITGQDYLTNGESITFSHDDGALIYVCAANSTCTASNSTLITAAGGQMQTVAGQPPFTFTGTTGQYTFLLIYNANYAQPSELQTNINSGTIPSSIPEPNSLMLLGSGLVSAAGMFSRRRRANA